MLDWSQCSAVESVPEKLSGAWVFRGTRLPVLVTQARTSVGAGYIDIAVPVNQNADQVGTDQVGTAQVRTKNSIL